MWLAFFMKHLQDADAKLRYRYHQKRSRECIEFEKQALGLETEWSSAMPSFDRKKVLLPRLVELYGELGRRDTEWYYLKEWYRELSRGENVDSTVLGEVCYRLGVLSEEMGRPEDAVNYHREELALSQDAPEERGPILCNLANAMESMRMVSH
jgi:hypothetical protein